MPKNTKVAIIGNGPTYNWSEVAASYDVIIAADGGAQHCSELGIAPTMIIGDGDSYSSLPKPSLDQHTTDLQKCIQYAQTNYPNAMIDLISCFSEDRPDHSLAAALCLQNLPVGSRLITSTSTLHWLHNTLEILAPNTDFSIIPIQAEITVSISNAEWSGNEVRISQLGDSGISNKTTAVNCSISNISHAPAIVVVYDHAYTQMI